jgi:hypothetical protein
MTVQNLANLAKVGQVPYPMQNSHATFTPSNITFHHGVHEERYCTLRLRYVEQASPQTSGNISYDIVLNSVNL